MVNRTLLCSTVSSHLFGQFGVAKFLTVQVKHTDYLSVLDFHFAQIVQFSTPITELAENFCGAAREQNVSCISTVHHSLSNIDSSASHVTIRIDIGDAIDGARVYSHAQLYAGRLIPERSTQF